MGLSANRPVRRKITPFRIPYSGVWINERSVEYLFTNIPSAPRRDRKAATHVTKAYWRGAAEVIFLRESQCVSSWMTRSPGPQDRGRLEGDHYNGTRTNGPSSVSSHASRAQRARPVFLSFPLLAILSLLHHRLNHLTSPPFLNIRSIQHVADFQGRRCGEAQQGRRPLHHCR